MNTHVIAKQLIDHEGVRQHPYKCTAGKLTIGIGRNLEDKGLSKDEAVYLLGNDIRECIDDLQGIFPDHFDRLPEKIQHVLIDMRFQLGPGRFRKFKNMIFAVRMELWSDMIAEMKDSAWYQQVPVRANNLIKMVKEIM